MSAPAPRRSAWRLRAALLLAWAAAAFGTGYFARDLSAVLAGWPVNFWWAAQGGVLVFIAIAMLYAWAMNRRPPEADDDTAAPTPPPPADAP